MSKEASNVLEELIASIFRAEVIEVGFKVSLCRK
jgi:hypothetical protein